MKKNGANPTLSSVYVASPLGFSESGRYFLREYLMPELSKLNVKIHDPWAQLVQRNQLEILRESQTMSSRQAIEIGEMNANMIRESDTVLAILDGPDVDSGVATEIGYAYGIGKRIIGYRGDFRLSADCPACNVNLQVETFITKSGGRIYSDLDTLISSLGNEMNS